jgi:hypothetical protein
MTFTGDFSTMTTYELLSLIGVVIAIVISIINSVMNRKMNKKMVKMQRPTAALADKELARIEEVESLADQPRFVITTIKIVGFDPKEKGYTSKIYILIQNLGDSYSEAKFVLMLRRVAKTWRQPPNAYLDPIDIREHDRILGERIITLRPNSMLRECFIHIHYMDKFGTDQFQEFEILPEGGFERAPSDVKFRLKTIYRLSPSEYWHG